MFIVFIFISIFFGELVLLLFPGPHLNLESGGDMKFLILHIAPSSGAEAFPRPWSL